ncbi:WbqC family protein [Planctomycetota bacterium]
MKMAIMQPYFFPYLGYFQLLKAANKFVLYDDVTFIKGGWINRNRILVHDTEYLFTVPLANAGSNTLIKDLQVASHVDRWYRKMVKTLKESYKKAAFFNETLSLIEKSVPINNKWFIDWLLASHESIIDYLKMEVQLLKCSDIYSSSKHDRASRLMEICKKENCQTYINLQGGSHLYEKAAFEESGIELLFLKSRLPYYRQFNNEFVPGLSIIDVLMFNPPDIINEYLCSYDLI